MPEPISDAKLERIRESIAGSMIQNGYVCDDLTRIIAAYRELRDDTDADDLHHLWLGSVLGMLGNLTSDAVAQGIRIDPAETDEETIGNIVGQIEQAIRDHQGYKWVSVKDRLPETYDRVLLTFVAGDGVPRVCESMRYGPMNRWHYPGLGWVAPPYRAVAWMPLPAPAKEQP